MTNTMLKGEVRLTVGDVEVGEMFSLPEEVLRMPAAWDIFRNDLLAAFEKEQSK